MKAHSNLLRLTTLESFVLDHNLTDTVQSMATQLNRSSNQIEQAHSRAMMKCETLLQVINHAHYLNHLQLSGKTTADLLRAFDELSRHPLD